MSEAYREVSHDSPEEQVCALYTDLALHPEKDFGWGTGKANARALGYELAWLKKLPTSVRESAAAVGNHFAIGPINRGETVIDLGCGAGAAVCIAASLVGPTGRVIDVDLTPAMVAKARTSTARAELHNVTIFRADIAELPLPDALADVVISNGAINLSPHKPCVVKEAFRVLKRGGRLYIADMIRDPSRSPGEPSTSANAWANCVAGTLAPECFVQMLKDVGFVGGNVDRHDGLPHGAHTPS